MTLFFWFYLFFEARAEIQKYFCSFFGSNENFRFCFRDLENFISYQEFSLFSDNPPTKLKCQWGQFQGNYNDSNSKVILPFIIVDFYSLKAHFHTKQEIGMLYVTLRIGNITLLTIYVINFKESLKFHWILFQKNKIDQLFWGDQIRSKWIKLEYFQGSTK